MKSDPFYKRNPDILSTFLISPGVCEKLCLACLLLNCMVHSFFYEKGPDFHHHLHKQAKRVL